MQLLRIDTGMLKYGCHHDITKEILSQNMLTRNQEIIESRK